MQFLAEVTYGRILNRCLFYVYFRSLEYLSYSYFMLEFAYISLKS